MVLNCPTGLASPAEAAKAVAGLASEGRIGGKPVADLLAGRAHGAPRRAASCRRPGWRASRRRPTRRRPSPISADWSRAQKALMRVPSSRSEDVAGDREAVLAIFRQVAKEGRRMLTEPEAKAALAAYGIPVPETIVAKTPADAGVAAARLLETSRQGCRQAAVQGDLAQVRHWRRGAEHRNRRRCRASRPRHREPGPRAMRRMPTSKAMPCSRWWCASMRRN